MFWNAFIIALREIRRNLPRAFLTVLGVVIGVAAVVTMVTLGRGATESVKAQISNLGSNLLVRRPGQGWGPSAAPLFSASSQAAGFTSTPMTRQPDALRICTVSCPTRPRPITKGFTRSISRSGIGRSPQAASSMRRN